MKPNILFVCGRNKWRSPTAEKIYKNDQRRNVRSAGISEKSNHQVNGNDIFWADLIVVFEHKYKSWIIEKFRDLHLLRIKNMDIPDEYEYMNPELVEMIKDRVEDYIKYLADCI